MTTTQNTFKATLPKTIALLADWSQIGKNASVLLQVAKSIHEGKDLPQWANVVFQTKGVEEILSLPSAKLKKVCSLDSFATLRSLVNIDLKNQYLSSKQLDQLKQLLKIQSFANNQHLLDMLEKNERFAKLNKDADKDTDDNKEDVKAQDADKDADQGKDADKDQDQGKVQDLAQILERIGKMDDLSELAKILQATQERVNALSTGNKTGKVA